LNYYEFRNIEEVQEVADEWMEEYNNHRPHESLKNLSPRKYVEKFA
jgi:putative transposase